MDNPIVRRPSLREMWLAFCRENHITEAHIRAALGTPRVSVWLVRNPAARMEDAMAMVKQAQADF